MLEVHHVGDYCRQLLLKSWTRSPYDERLTSIFDAVPFAISVLLETGGWWPCFVVSLSWFPRCFLVLTSNRKWARRLRKMLLMITDSVEQCKKRWRLSKQNWFFFSENRRLHFVWKIHKKWMKQKQYLDETWNSRGAFLFTWSKRSPAVNKPQWK